jgi:hypothetical protein
MKLTNMDATLADTSYGNWLETSERASFWLYSFQV